MIAMSGLELVENVRADETLRATPVIMVASSGDVSDREAAEQAGADNYIVRPFNANTLKEKISAVLGVL